MAKTWYEIVIDREGEQLRRRVSHTNAKKAAQQVAAEYGLTLTGKSPSLHSATQWHATDAEGRAALVTASR